MDKPGRKSDAALKLASVSVLPVGACRAPASLTPDQAKIWQEIVADKPAGWLTRDISALLEAYCVAIERREFITAQLNKLVNVRTRAQLEKFERFSDLEKKQTMLVASLATKMRLTQQSRYTPGRAGTAAKNAPEIPPPWAKS